MKFTHLYSKKPHSKFPYLKEMVVSGNVEDVLNPNWMNYLVTFQYLILDVMLKVKNKRFTLKIILFYFI